MGKSALPEADGPWRRDKPIISLTAAAHAGAPTEDRDSQTSCCTLRLLPSTQLLLLLLSNISTIVVFRVFPCGHFNSNCFSRVLHQHVLQDISCFSQTKFLFSSKEMTEQGSLKCFWIEGICPDMRPYLTCSCSQCPYGWCLEQVCLQFKIHFTLQCDVPT